MKLAPLALLILVGCTTTIKQYLPTTTATEQGLLAQSAMNATTAITKNLSNLGLVYVDTSLWEGNKFTIGLIEAALLRQGAQLTMNQKASQTTVVILNGVQSINDRIDQFGIPGLTIPVGLNSNYITTSPIDVTKKDRNQAVTQISLFAYRTVSGQFVENIGSYVGIEVGS